MLRRIVGAALIPNSCLNIILSFQREKAKLEFNIHVWRSGG